MQLPEAESSVIEPRKLRDYLLSPMHPVGSFKAAFFARLGYNQDDWGTLATDFRIHAVQGEATEAGSSPFGRKFEVRGEMTGPSGDRAEIVTVWIILKGEDRPRFITAYPGARREARQG